MKCPECGVDGIIDAGRNEVEGDDSPDRKTRVFRVLVYRCRNPHCAQNGQEIGLERVELPLMSG